MRKSSIKPVAGCGFISAQRLHAEPVECAARPFLIDLERILHSSSLRRLQGKTQVWGVHESDLFRTRLTHSLETALIGRKIARVLNLDADLVEALCLAHDLGHPPFAHEGARLLDYFAREHSEGRVRFDDNAQNLRIITRLASSHLDEGLNPSAALVDGLIKYKRVCANSCGWYPEEDEIVAWAARLCGTGDRRNPLASLVEISDDLAYACHDLEDAIRAGMIQYDMLMHAFASLASEKARSIVKRAFEGIIDRLKRPHDPDALRHERGRLRFELLRIMLDEILELSESREFQQRFIDPSCHDTLNPYLVELPHIAELLEVLKEVVLERVIHAPNVQTLRFAGLSLMESYLKRFWPLLNEPQHPMYRHYLMSLPREWQVNLCQASSCDSKLRLLLDYVAGMSDNYLMEQASMFFNPIPYRAIENRK